MDITRRVFIELAGVALSGTGYRFGVDPDEDYHFGGDEVASVSPSPIIRDTRILFFSTEWCGPCKRVKREVFPALKKSGWVVGRGTGCHIETLSPSSKYQITSVPTWILIKGGKEQKRMTGFRTAVEVADWFNSFVKPTRIVRAGFVSSPYDSPSWTTGENLSRHLTRVHRYSQSQVDGLSRRQRVALHSRAHNTPGFGYNPRRSVQRQG